MYFGSLLVNHLHRHSHTQWQFGTPAVACGGNGDVLSNGTVQCRERPLWDKNESSFESCRTACTPLGATQTRSGKALTSTTSAQTKRPPQTKKTRLFPEEGTESGRLPDSRLDQQYTTYPLGFGFGFGCYQRGSSLRLLFSSAN